MGYSKEHHPDLPQVVTGFAVTLDGIPIRCWVWPGNTSDMSVVPEVKKDLTGWKLGSVITVVDRGFWIRRQLARTPAKRRALHRGREDDLRQTDGRSGTSSSGTIQDNSKQSGSQRGRDRRR